MSELTFVVTEDPDGVYNARALGHSICTQAETRDELIANARGAVGCHFDAPAETSEIIRLEHAHDDVVAV